MPTSPDVDDYMAALEHPHAEHVQRLRLAILAAHEGMTETIKWNAPNFRFNGEDRVTFRLAPKDRLQLILHRGAKVRDASGFAFDDDTGLIEWAAPDRGVITLTPALCVDREADLVRLVGRWVEA